ncbi:MAG: hypothetical protein U1F41_14870 [Burkholderiales bacterium]
MKPAPATDDIEAVEKRIEMRRAALARRYDEVREGVKVAAAKSARSWPLLLLGGSLAAGYAMSRAPRRAALQCATLPPEGMQPARTVASAAPADPSSHWMGKVAAVLGIAATAVRIATSGEARALLEAYKTFRARRRQAAATLRLSAGGVRRARAPECRS